MVEKISIRRLDSCFDNRTRGIKLVGLVTLALTFAFCGVAVEAQQPTKVPQVGQC